MKKHLLLFLFVLFTVIGVSATTYTDELTAAKLSLGTSYQTKTYSGGNAKGVTYTAYAMKNNTNDIQINNKSGYGVWISANTNGYTVKSVEVNIASGKGVIINGSTSPYSAVDTNTSNPAATISTTGKSTFDFSDKGFKALSFYANGGASYISSITIVWDDGADGKKETVTLSFPAEEYEADVAKGPNSFDAPALSVTPSELSSKITYASSNPSVATVDASNGTVTLLSVGSTDITASFAGDNTYASASKSYTLNVKDSDAKAYYKVTNINDMKDGAQYIIVCDEKNFAMSTTQNGNNRGQVSINIESDGGIIPGGDVAIVTVKKVSGGYTLYVNNGTSTGYLVNPSGGNYLRTQNNEAVYTVSISSNGNATLSNGGRTIQYNPSNGIFASYSTNQTAVQLYMLPKGAEDYTALDNVADITIDYKGTGKVDLGDSHPVINWAYNPAGIVTIDAEGNISAVGTATGTTEVTASWTATPDWNADSAKFNVIVSKPFRSDYTAPFKDKAYTFNLVDEDQSIELGDKHPEIKYTYEPEGILTIDDNGKVSPIEVGKVEIKAEWTETDEWNADNATFTVTIEKKNYKYAFPTELSLYVDGTADLYEGADHPEFTVDVTENNDVISVDGAKVTGIKPGSAEVIVSWGDDKWATDKAIVNVTVTEAPKESTVTFDFVFTNNTDPDNYPYGIKTLYDSENTNNTKYLSKDGETASKEDVSVLFNSNVDECWRMWSDGIRAYAKAATKNPSFTVSANGNNITKIEITAASGITFKVEGYNNDANVTTWEGNASEITFVCTASDNGALKTITVTFEKTGDDPDVPTLNSPELKFAEIDVKVDFEVDGTYTQAVSNPHDLSGIVYSSSVESVATVDSTTGEVSFVNYGKTVISAEFKGNDQYEAQTVSYTLTLVNPNAGDGTEDKPYSVAELKDFNLTSSTMEGIYVVGYIVGSLPNGSKNNVVFGAEGAANTNLIIADSADETSVDNCASIQLPTGTIRTALNLQDNAGNVGRKVMIGGTAKPYCGLNGINPTTSYRFLDEAPVVTVEAPVFDPDPKNGPVRVDQAIDLTCETEGATIYYKTNKMDKAAQFIDGAPMITVNPDCNIVTAWAELDGYKSIEVEATYEFYKVLTPRITPSAEYVSPGTEVKITCDTPDAIIYYWVVSDDDQDMDDFEKYTPDTHIYVNGEMLIYAKATFPDWLDSEVAEALFDVVDPTQQVQTTSTFDFSADGDNVTAMEKKNEKEEDIDLAPGDDKTNNSSMSYVTFTNNVGVKLNINSNSYTSAPRWWKDNVVRMYGNSNGGNALTITAPDAHTLVEITFIQDGLSGDNTKFSLSADAGELNKLQWTRGSEKVSSVTFNASDATRFNAIKVTYERTAHKPELISKGDNQHVYQVMHGRIVVEIISGDKKPVRRFANFERPDAPANWEYLDDQTAVYTVPNADTNEYHIYGIFDNQDSDPDVSEPIVFNWGVATGVGAIAAEYDADADYYNLQGVKVANPERGIYICVKNGKALKVVL